MANKKHAALAADKLTARMTKRGAHAIDVRKDPDHDGWAVFVHFSAKPKRKVAATVRVTDGTTTVTVPVHVLVEEEFTPE